MTSAVGDNFETDSAPRKKGERSQPAKQTADWSVVTSVVATTTAERFSFWEIQELGTNHVQGIKK